MSTPKILTADALIGVLNDIITGIEAGDSFNGSLEYHAAAEKDTYEVVAVISVGNADGSQGGYNMIGTP